MMPDISEKQFVLLLVSCLLVLLAISVVFSSPVQPDPQPVQLGDSTPSKTNMSAVFEGNVSTPPQSDVGIQTRYSITVETHNYSSRTYHVHGRTQQRDSSVIGYIMSSSINTTIDSVPLTSGMRIEPTESAVNITDATGTQTRVDPNRARPQYYSPATVYNTYKDVPVEYTKSVQLDKNFTQVSEQNTEYYTYTQDTFRIYSTDITDSSIPVFIGGTEIETIEGNNGVKVTVTRSTLNEIIAIKVSSSRVVNGDVITESVEYRYRAYASST